MSVAAGEGASTMDEPCAKPSVVAICGDSITTQLLYSVFIEDYLLMCQAGSRHRVVQLGYSGEATWGFSDRVATDVLPLAPQWVFTCYGMNDGGFVPPDPDILGYYREGQREIVRELKRAGIRQIIVGSPGCVDIDSYANGPGAGQSRAAILYNETLANLRDAARALAEEEGVLFADVFTPMIEAMTRAKAKYGNAWSLAAKDGIHPAACGHLPIAHAFLKAMGSDGDIGTITLDWVSGRAEATGGHRVLSVRQGVIQVESTRYPFCFFGSPTSPDATTGIIEFLPFNQELNRLQLVVTGAPVANLRVTWGVASKLFTASQLRHGINLAAEFLDNPFCGPFRHVEQIVRAKQLHELALVQIGQGELDQVKEILQEETTSRDHMVSLVSEAAGRLREALTAAIVPVPHTIRIEPAQ